MHHLGVQRFFHPIQETDGVANTARVEIVTRGPRRKWAVRMMDGARMGRTLHFDSQVEAQQWLASQGFKSVAAAS